MQTTYYDKLEMAGHVLKRDEDGDIDSWVLSYEHHNGPGCVNCYDSWCEHCEDPISQCIGKETYEARAKEQRYKMYLELKEEFDAN